MTPTNEDMTTSLTRVERWHGIRILTAAMVDDETRGLPSTKPSPHVTFVYVRPEEDYFSTRRLPDTIRESDHDIDLTGYDLRAFLPTLAASDADALEFLTSRRVVRETPSARPLRTMAPSAYDRRNVALRRLDDAASALHEQVEDDMTRRLLAVESAYHVMTAKAALRANVHPPLEADALARDADCADLMPPLLKLSDPSRDADETRLVETSVRRWVESESSRLREEAKALRPAPAVNERATDDLFRRMVRAAALEDEDAARTTPETKDGPRPRICVACPVEAEYVAKDVTAAAQKHAARKYETERVTTCTWPELRLSPVERMPYVGRLMEFVSETDKTLVVVTQDMVVMRAVEVMAAKFRLADRVDFMLVRDAHAPDVADGVASEDVYAPYADALQAIENATYDID